MWVRDEPAGVGARNAVDEAFEPEPAEIVGHLRSAVQVAEPGGDLGRIGRFLKSRGGSGSVPLAE